MRWTLVWLHFRTQLAVGVIKLWRTSRFPQNLEIVKVCSNVWTCTKMWKYRYTHLKLLLDLQKWWWIRENSGQSYEGSTIVNYDYKIVSYSSQISFQYNGSVVIYNCGAFYMIDKWFPSTLYADGELYCLRQNSPLTFKFPHSQSL